MRTATLDCTNMIPSCHNVGFQLSSDSQFSLKTEFYINPWHVWSVSSLHFVHGLSWKEKKAKMFVEQVLFCCANCVIRFLIWRRLTAGLGLKTSVWQNFIWGKMDRNGHKSEHVKLSIKDFRFWPRIRGHFLGFVKFVSNCTVWSVYPTFYMTFICVKPIYFILAGSNRL